MEDLQLTESEVVNDWIRLGYARGVLESQRWCILALLSGRFPSAVTPEMTKQIEMQDDMERLGRWFDAALDAPTFADFLATMTQ